MTQHNNNLSLHQQGKDVALLHRRLMTMGHTIATSETLGELFGESTQQAVIQFQQAWGLPVTGSVDGATSQAIMSRFESGKTVIMHMPLPIHPSATVAPPAISEVVLGKAVEIVRESPPPLPSAQGKPVVGIDMPIDGAHLLRSDGGGDPLLHSPVGEVGGGIDVPPPPATGVPVHTPPGEGRPLDPSLLIREEIAAVQLLQQQHGLELSGVVDEPMTALPQWEPGLEVAPIGFGSVKTMSAF
jgi:hypothetical protein